MISFLRFFLPRTAQGAAIGALRPHVWNAFGALRGWQKGPTDLSLELCLGRLSVQSCNKEAFQRRKADREMATKRINVERFSVTSSKSFADVIAAFEAAVGRPDMKAFQTNAAATKTYAELEKIVRGAVGPSGLMEFARFDLGEVLRKAVERKPHTVCISLSATRSSCSRWCNMCRMPVPMRP